MAGKKFSKGSKEWQMFMDYWNLCQKFWEPEDNDQYWEQVISEADAFYRKYNTGLSRGWSVELVAELERKHKGANERT